MSSPQRGHSAASAAATALQLPITISVRTYLIVLLALAGLGVLSAAHAFPLTLWIAATAGVICGGGLGLMLGVIEPPS